MIELLQTDVSEGNRKGGECWFICNKSKKNYGCMFIYSYSLVSNKRIEFKAVC